MDYGHEESEFCKLKWQKFGRDFELHVLKLGNLHVSSPEMLVEWACELKVMGNCCFKRKRYSSTTLIYETILDFVMTKLTEKVFARPRNLQIG